MGLAVGKPAGIFLSSWLALKLGLATLPLGMKESHLGVVGILGGVGFTMCIFLCEQCFVHSGPAKLAVMCASAFAAIVAAAIMSRMEPQPAPEIPECVP